MGGRVENPIDRLMERASCALARTDYFEALRDAWSGLRRARAAADFDRMSRICLPLLEARRQIRLEAESVGHVRLLSHPADVPRPLAPGCYLIQPPMIGADARVLRDTATKAKIAVSVLAREPLTLRGLWPIVGVGEISVRVQIDPPAPLERVEGHITRDGFVGPVPLVWFRQAGEALGDAAIGRVPADLHPHWRVDDLLEALEAVPEHEGLHRALAEACREAVGVEAPQGRRPSPLDNPYSF